MRTREHVLEELSRRAFRDILPAEWVLRDQAPDYGLDAQVEPFVDGVSTGDFFFVQLKATDSEGGSIRIKTDRLKYYSASKQPVLLVCFSAPSSEMYCAWAHTVVASLSFHDSHWWTQQTVTCALHHRLNADSFSQLLGDVRSFYRTLNSGSTAPLKLAFEFPNDGERASVERELASWVSRFSDRIHFSREVSVTTIRVNHEWSQYSVEFVGFGINPGMLSSHAPLSRQARIDILKLLVALAVSQGGLRREANAMLRDLIEGIANGSPVVALLLTVPPWIIVHAVRAPDAALEIAEALVDRSLFTEAMVAADVASMLLDLMPTAGAFRDSQRLRRLFQKALAGAIQPQHRSVLHFNLANSLVRSGLSGQALEHFRSTVDVCPAYLDDARWWAGVGAALAGRRCLRLARRCLIHAVELTPSKPIRGLLGSLDFSLRRFESARGHLDEWFKDNPKLDAAWVLRWALAPVFANEFGEGRRATSAALKIAKGAYKEPLAQQQAILHEALKLDPLCDLAWRNYAHCRSVVEPANACVWWAAAALLSVDWDLETCVIAYLRLIHEQGEPLIALAVLVLMFRSHGEAIFLEIAKCMGASGADQVDAVVKHARFALEGVGTLMR